MLRSGRWLGLLVLLVVVPGVRGQQTPEERAKALDIIRGVGGTVVIDGDKADSPVTRIELNGPRVTDEVLAQVRGFGLLRSLSLCRTRITDAGLDNLKDLRVLQVLYLTYDRISDRGLERLVTLDNLEVLGLSYTDVSD